MRRKNVFEFCILGLFIMCMGLALSAALEYVTVGSEREYLGQGKWMLSLLCISLASFFGVRMAHKIGLNAGRGLKNALTAAACALLFFAGLWLRMWVIENIPIEPDSDFETYYRMALELYNDTMLSPAAALDRRYAAMYPHTIGFPMLVLQPAFHLFGPGVKTALYANLVCSMLSVIIAGHIGKRIAGKVGAVLAVAATSLWPSHILFANMVATEQSFTMMMLLAADIMVHVMDRSKGSLYDTSPLRGLALLVLLGIVLALGGAIRPMAMVLLAAYAVVQLFIGGDPKGEITQSGSRWALARGWMCVLLVVIPYVLTGNIVTKAISDTIQTQPATGLTASGYNLMVGVNTSSGGRWNDEDSRFFGDYFDETGDAAAAHQACMQKAIERITQSPEDVLNLLVYKFRDLWQTDDFGVDWNLQWTDMQGTLTPQIKQLMENVRPTGRVMYMAVLLFALMAAIEAWRRSTAPQPMQMVCVLFFLGTALAHMLLETQVRYHYNMIPFLILLGVYAVAGWRQRMAEEPAVKLVKVANLGMDEAMSDHTNFDMHTALKEGHVHMSVSKAVADEAARRSIAVEAAAEEALPLDEVETVEAEPEKTEEQQQEPQIEAEHVAEEAPAVQELQVEESAPVEAADPEDVQELQHEEEAAVEEIPAEEADPVEAVTETEAAASEADASPEQPDLPAVPVVIPVTAEAAQQEEKPAEETSEPEAGAEAPADTMEAAPAEAPALDVVTETTPAYVPVSQVQTPVVKLGGAPAKMQNAQRTPAKAAKPVPVSSKPVQAKKPAAAKKQAASAAKSRAPQRRQKRTMAETAAQTAQRRRDVQRRKQLRQRRNNRG